jgi:hypothetical protein
MKHSKSLPISQAKESLFRSEEHTSDQLKDIREQVKGALDKVNEAI